MAQLGTEENWAQYWSLMDPTQYWLGLADAAFYTNLHGSVCEEASEPLQKVTLYS